VYVLDEPTTGLHFEDIRKLLLVLESLVDKGNTVIVIEHNLDVIKTADWLVDMGPEGGHRGGVVVAAGTPEEVAEIAESHTGAFLRPVLGLDGQPAGGSAQARAEKANGSGRAPAKKAAKSAPRKATKRAATAAR
jgi:excinuclease ABC subunit A